MHTRVFFKVFSLPVTLFLESMSWFNPSFAVPWLLLHNDLIFPSTTPGHRDFPSQEEAIHATPVVGLSLIITGKQSPYSVTWLSILLEVVNGDFQLNVLPDRAEGLSFAAGSGDDAPRLDDLWGTNELLRTFGFRKNLFLWFGGVGQPVVAILHRILSISCIRTGCVEWFPQTGSYWVNVVAISRVNERWGCML